jgi:Spy/CpxP family protein refolding chaperone
MRTTLQAFALGTVLSLGLSTAAVFAQAPDAATAPPDASAGQGMHHHGPPTTEEQLEHMSKALKLTTDQQSQIKPLLDARRQQMMQMHEDKSLSREDRMTKFKALDDDTHVKIEAVLDQKQKEKFEKMQERREERMEQHQGDGMRGGQQPPPQ